MHRWNWINKMIPIFSELNISASLSNYSRMGDVGVIAICCVIFILLGTSYVVRSKSYRVFSAIIGFILLAAIANIGFHELLARNDIVKNNPYVIGLLYLLRVLYHTLLFNIFFQFALYATIVSNMAHKRARLIAIIGTILFLGCVAVDVILTFTGVGFKIVKETGEALGGSNVFMIGYVVYVLFLAILMFRIRKLVYKRVLLGFYATMMLSVIVRFAQMGFDASHGTRDCNTDDVSCRGAHYVNQVF